MLSQAIQFLPMGTLVLGLALSLMARRPVQLACALSLLPAVLAGTLRQSTFAEAFSPLATGSASLICELATLALLLRQTWRQTHLLPLQMTAGSIISAMAVLLVCTGLGVGDWQGWAISSAAWSACTITLLLATVLEAGPDRSAAAA